MKKLTKATLSVFLFVLMFVVSGIQAQAASKAEIESTGTKMTLNKEVKGVLTSCTDENWFIFQVTQPGYFNLTFNTVYADVNDIGDGWDVYIYDTNDLVNTIQEYRGQVNTFTTANFAMHTGTYYVMIDAHDESHKSDAPINCEFGLTVNYQVDSTWEVEYNSETNVANSKRLNSEIKGNLYHYKDEDWYKFTVDKSGVVEIVFSTQDYVDVRKLGDGWDIELWDTNLTKMTRTENVKGNYISQKYGLEAGTYYVLVDASDESHKSDAPVACDYSLTLKYVVDTTWESEGNNTSDLADEIKVGTSYHGALYQAQDNDWYKLNLSKSGVMKFDFAKNVNESIQSVKEGWNVYFIDAKTNESIFKMDAVETSANQQIALAKGTYFIRVCCEDKYSAPVGCQYDFKVSFTQSPSKTKIKSIKSSKKKVTLKWKKVSGANGYYIYRSTSKKGTYKKVATIKKGTTVKYTDKKGLKKKKTYYYKIVAYKKANGITATSADSAVKKVKVK
ncbi:MAG: hypothetical protein E7264_03375 [Lachnospiraceae bacterium]|nr:hypothetical protein [Lachnospiraceae bacterium]